MSIASTPITTQPVPKHFHRKLLSSAGLNPFTSNDSPSRQTMFANSHVAQKITCSGMNERYCQTGMEYEFGRATFSVKMPCKGKILQIIKRYPEGAAADSIKENPETTVVYENVETKEVGILVLPTYFSYHSYFGFPYKPSKGLDLLRLGAEIPIDTIFLDSPGITETGNYAYGRELNTVFMSHPAISEDGIVISRDVLPFFSFKRYETRSVEWGEKTFALNIFGKEGTNEYKIFPDIGELVRDDGMLMAFRTYDEDLVPVDMNVNALRHIDYAYDERVYANGGGGKIIDIKVTTNFDVNQGISDMDIQTEKYIIRRREYFEQIVKVYEQLKRNKGLQVTREFHALVVKAYTELASGKNRLIKLFRKTPLDLFRVDFVIEYTVQPTTGFKMTELHGGRPQ